MIHLRPDMTVKLYYVYGLSVNEAVFYVGVTTNPILRYQSHVSANSSETAGLIRFLRKAGILPQMELGFVYDDRKLAELKERETIGNLQKLRYALCNTVGNEKDNKIIFPAYYHDLPFANTLFQYQEQIENINIQIGIHERRYKRKMDNTKKIMPVFEDQPPETEQLDQEGQSPS